MARATKTTTRPARTLAVIDGGNVNALPPRRRGRPSKQRLIAESFAAFGLFPEVE